MYLGSLGSVGKLRCLAPVVVSVAWSFEFSVVAFYTSVSPDPQRAIYFAMMPGLAKSVSMMMPAAVLEDAVACRMAGVLHLLLSLLFPPNPCLCPPAYLHQYRMVHSTISILGLVTECSFTASRAKGVRGSLASFFCPTPLAYVLRTATRLPSAF